MSGYLPPSLLEKMEIFDSGATDDILTRAKEIQIQNQRIREESTDKDTVKNGLIDSFRPASLKTMFITLFNFFGSAQNYRHAIKLSTPGESLERVQQCLRQAANEYIEQNDFPRDTLSARERAFLDENADDLSVTRRPQARI